MISVHTFSDNLRKYTPAAVAMTVALAGMFLASSAHAADNVSLGITLQDTNNNGKIDRAQLSIDNDAAQTWVVNGTPSTAALSATQSGAAITISATAISGSATADPVTVNVDFDENDADLLTSTDGITEAVFEVIYNDVDGTSTCTNCIRDDSAELASWVTGDSATADTEIDGASPVVSAVAVTTNTISSITYNALAITYTENIQLSTDAGGDNDIAQGASGTSTATLGDAFTGGARTLAGIGTWNGTSDCVNSAATVNTIASADSTLLTVVTISFNTAAAGYWTTCATGPSTDTFTPTADANDVQDLNTLSNAVNTTTRAMTVTTAWDVTAPTISNTWSCDTDNDGDINRLQVDVSESIIDSVSNTVTSWEGDNDSANDGTGEEDAATWNTATGGCDGNADDADADDAKFRIDLTTGISGTDSAYVNLDTAGPRDWAGNRMATVAGGGTENDKARPVLTASTPASAATGVSRTQVVTLTFSEAPASLTASNTPSAGLTVGSMGTSVTVTPVIWTSGSNTFTVSTAPDAAGNTFYGAQSGGTAVHPFSFTVVSSSSTTSGSSSTVADTIAITSPAGGESYEAGETVDITWETTGNGISYVDITLNVETDDGTTIETLIQDTPDDGEWEWTVPDVTTSNATITITGTDLADDVDTDFSDSFSIVGTETGDDEDSDDEDAEDEDSDEGSVAEDSGEMGISPVTGEPEAISVVSAGDYIRGSSYTTVYYVDADMVRHPFVDSQTWFTYEDDFDDVVEVTDATLTSLTLGIPMLPKVGVVLVKIQSVAKVYALVENEDGDTELRWIVSEDVATDLYGDDWADYVIDVSDTLWARFAQGDDVDGTDDLDVDMDGMKLREELS